VRIAILKVFRMLFWIPGTAADAFDEILADSVTFDRERMVGITDIHVVERLEIGLRTSR
jgi:hypothetical protein